MGRKHSNISGLSRFVQEAFNSEATLSAPAASLESPVVETSVTIMHATSGNYVAGTTRRASELPDGTTQSEIRPSKKRKVGLLGPGQEKYDATGLVPFYTQASQVPTHLQKCALTELPSIIYKTDLACVRLFSARTLLFAVLFRLSPRRRGLVQRHS